MRAVRLLAAAALAAGVVACAPDREPGPAAAGPTPASPSAAPPRSPASPDPPATRPERATRPATPDPAPPSRRPEVTSPPFDGDRTGDLVRGVRTLRGVVERDGDWVLLRVDAERWALLGARARALAGGSTVEVRGTVAAPPPGCPVDRALQVVR
ncbi:hypothetical protein [Actinoplanes sp. NPDC049599]|uniref:hypothetical protein n=1 Tax=Actinoplanes sp. NPDC049599 TaxID=3363903 RepID=UPI003796EB97